MAEGEPAILPGVGGISVIVPSLAGGDKLRSLLESLAVQTAAHELIVVDNGSPGAAVSKLVAEFDGAEALRLDRNAGFSRAVNLAAQQAGGDSLVLLNDDCHCEPEFVERIVAALDPGSGVVMSAGVMRDRDDHSLIDTAGMELDRTLLVFDYLNGHPIELLDAGEVEAPIGPCAATAAFDRDAFLAVGGFDERLFAYWEDVDLVLRLRREGGRCALAAGARGVHEHSSTLGPGSAAKNYLTGYGRGYTLRRWGVLTPARLPGILARDLPICIGQALIDRNVTGISGRIRGLREAPGSLGYPEADLAAHSADGTLATLRRRFNRRRMLRARPKAGVAVGSGELRALVVLHDSGVTGPGRTLEILFSRCRGIGPIWLDPAAADHRYGPLTAAGGALGWPRAAVAQAQAAWWLRGEARAAGAGLVVASSAMLPAAVVAARLAGVPCVLMANELAPGGSDSRRRPALEIMRAEARAADMVVACSDAVAAQFDGIGTRVEVLRPPVEAPAKRRPADSRRALGIPADGKCILVAGSITRGRGQHLAIEALALLAADHPDLHLLIAGEPFDREPDRVYAAELAELIRIRGLEDRVHMPGVLDELDRAFAAADVVVNPCLVPESFGRVAFEAALAGRPVVSNRVGAVGELLRDGESALLVEPGDVAGLAAAIEHLLGDRKLARALAASAAAIAAEHLDPDRQAERFAELVSAVTA